MSYANKRDQMFACIESYRSSGLTQRQFCIENNLNFHTFQSWQKKCRPVEKQDHSRRDDHLSAHGFIPVQMPGQSKADQLTGRDYVFQIEYPHGVRLSLGIIPDVELIKTLLFFKVS